MARFYYLDKHGWPIEKFKGRPIYNLIRILFRCRGLSRKRPAHLKPPYWYCYDCKNIKKYVEKENRNTRGWAICPGCERNMIFAFGGFGMPTESDEAGNTTRR